MKRPDWRSIANTLSKAAPPSPKLYVFGKFSAPLIYYCERNDISGPITKIDVYQQTVWDKMLVTDSPVWGACGLLIPGDKKHQVTTRISKKIHPFEMAYLFQLRKPKNDPKRIEDLTPLALSPDSKPLSISVTEKRSPFVGRGWHGIEDWGEDMGRSFLKGKGEILVPVEKPLPLQLTVPLIVYAPERGKPRKMRLKVNGVPLAEKRLEGKYVQPVWNVPAKVLDPGLNSFVLEADKTFQPSKIEENNDDSRELSAWASQMTIAPAGGS